MHRRIVWRNLTAKPLQTSLIAAVVALAVTMTVTIMLLADGMQAGLVRATEPFDLIVGAKGSPNQLVLNTVFLQDSPIGNIDYDVYAQLAAKLGVATAIPVGFGDNYRGYRIVGTTAAIYEHRIKPGQPPWLQMGEGRAFAAPFEAVIGAKAARELGIAVGDSFASVHGTATRSGGHSHDRFPYRVVGILKPVGGPYDQAILVPLESIWKIHEQPDKELSETPPDGDAHGLPDRHNEHDEHGEDAPGVTVVLVKPTGYAEAMRLYQEFQKEPRAQLVFPAQVIIRLFAMMGQGEEVLKTVAYTVIIMALLTMSLTLYWAALSRAKEHAILRAIGANAGDIFRIILLEGAVMVAAGVILGLGIGHGLFAALAGALQQKTAITIPLGLSRKELYLALGTVALGLMAGIVPAAIAYRFDAARNL